jgi:hypothetical protein
LMPRYALDTAISLKVYPRSSVAGDTKLTSARCGTPNFAPCGIAYDWVNPDIQYRRKQRSFRLARFALATVLICCFSDENGGYSFDSPALQKTRVAPRAQTSSTSCTIFVIIYNVSRSSQKSVLQYSRY